MSQLGIVSYAYRWSIGMGDRVPAHPMTPIQLLDRAVSMGLSLVQFADNMPLHELDTADRKALRVHANMHGVAIEVGQQGADMNLLRRYLDIAGELDAQLLRLALDAADASLAQELLVEDFAAAARLAEARGITLAIENHFGFPSPRLENLVQQVNSAHLGVCLDVANSICAGEWPAETIARLAPYCVNLHLKDYDIIPDPYGVGFRIQGTPLGAGRSDIDWILGLIAPWDRQCNVLLEHWLPGDSDLATLALREQQWIETSVNVARSHLSRSG